MTVLVTLNRYVAVCRPYSATDTNAVRRKARIHVALVAAFSVLFNVTRFLEWKIVDSEWSQTWLHENLLYKVYIGGCSLLGVFISLPDRYVGRP